jgi:hypothetical protein
MDGRDCLFITKPSQPPNQKIEVYPNEGSQTLAVVLQYQGVVDLAGVTAALKLPAGFKATLPLTDDGNRFDIAGSTTVGSGNHVPGSIQRLASVSSFDMTIYDNHGKVLWAALLHNSLIPSLYLSVYIFIATNMLYNDAFITNSLVML